MKKKGSMKARESVAKKTARKIVSIPCWAYWVQISTTRLESSTEARSAPVSRWIDSLMKATARFAPVVTA